MRDDRDDTGDAAHRAAAGGRAAAAARALAGSPIPGVTVAEADAVPAVEVYAPGRARPVLRVVNPPTLAADPAGEVALRGRARPGKAPQVRRYRVDPVGALLEVLAGREGGRRR